MAEQTVDAAKLAAEHFFRGLHALKAGDTSQAEAQFLKALELVPDRPSVLANLSIVYTRQGRFADALALVDRALAGDAGEPLYWLQKAAVQLRLDQHEGALESLAVVLEKNPDLAEAHNNRAAALKGLGRRDEALASYERAIALKPDYAEAHSNRGLILKDLGRAEEALASLDKAIALKPDYAEAHSNRGNVLKQLGRPEEALASYDRAIALRPDYAEAHNNRGIALKELKRPDEALLSYDRALALKPDYADAYNNRGAALWELDEPDQALASYDKAISLKPDYPEAFSNRGTVLTRLERSEEALQSYDRAISLNPADATAWQGRGRLHSELGAFADAEKSFEQAWALDTSKIGALCGLANLKKLKADDPLIALIEQALRQPGHSDEDLSGLHHAYGKICDDLGRHDEAMAHFARGKQLLASGFDKARHDAAYGALKALFTPQFFAERAGFGVPDVRPVFIVGMPRSGTTLTEQILASHPLAEGLGELPHLARVANDLGDFLENPKAFAAAVKALRPDDVARLADIYLKAYATVGAEKIRVIDKMPHNFQHLGLIALLFPRAHIIHCRRNPLDTCVSIYMQPFMEKHRYANDLTSLGEHYRQYEDLMAHWQQVLPMPIHESHYEEVIGDIETSTRDLLAFLGLDWDPACLSFQQKSRQVRTASVWQVRQPLYGTSVDRWQRYGAHLGPLKAALGLP